MFQASVSDKFIQQRAGHRSIPALHQYERNSKAQLLDILNVLSNHEGSSTLSCWNDEALETRVLVVKMTGVHIQRWWHMILL